MPLSEKEIAESYQLVKVIPENYWREVWHDAPCRGIMKRMHGYVEIEDGSKLGLYECMMCGITLAAGLDKNRFVTCITVYSDRIVSGF